MIQYGLQLYNRKWQLEDLINNAQTLEELDNIDINFNILGRNENSKTISQKSRRKKPK